MAREARKASRDGAGKVIRLTTYSKSTPSRRNGSKATAYGGGHLLKYTSKSLASYQCEIIVPLLNGPWSMKGYLLSLIF